MSSPEVMRQKKKKTDNTIQVVLTILRLAGCCVVDPRGGCLWLLRTALSIKHIEMQQRTIHARTRAHT